MNPVNPMHPMNPVNPMHPMNPVNPMHPMNPVNPMHPMNPMNPSLRSAELKQLAAATAADQARTVTCLGEHGGRLTSLEKDIETKSTLVAEAELREMLALCALRGEMREVIESIRAEVSSPPTLLSPSLYLSI